MGATRPAHLEQGVDLLGPPDVVQDQEEGAAGQRTLDQRGAHVEGRRGVEANTERGGPHAQAGVGGGLRAEAGPQHAAPEVGQHGGVPGHLDGQRRLADARLAVEGGDGGAGLAAQQAAAQLGQLGLAADKVDGAVGHGDIAGGWAAEVGVKLRRVLDSVPGDVGAQAAAGVQETGYLPSAA